MPRSYGDYNSVGGIAWQACGRWTVVSVNDPLPENFPEGDGGLPPTSIGEPVTTFNHFCTISGQVADLGSVKGCVESVTLNTVDFPTVDAAVQNTNTPVATVRRTGQSVG